MDELLLHFFNQTLAHPVLDALMPAVSEVGLALCPALGVALLVGRGRRRALGVALLAALVLGLALVLTLQFIVLRPRPDAVRLLIPAPNYPAFPSGHAMAGFATATVLGLAARRWRVALPAVAAATLLALSRVYLGHHYASDIFAGGVVGAGVGAACYGWVTDRGLARWRWLLWPQLALIVVVSQVAYLDRLPLALLRLPCTDKVLHFLMFGSVVFWLNLWLAPRRLRLGRLAGAPVAIAVPFGLALLEEGAQSFSSVRSAGWDDLAADLAGMVLFWALSQWLIARTLRAGMCT